MNPSFWSSLPRPAPTRHFLSSSSTKAHNGSDSQFASKIRALLKSTITKSRRGGYWFGLSQTERSLFSLAANLRIKFESVTLLRALVSILRKLKGMGDERYQQLRRGARMAWLFSEAAVSWGNQLARNWRNDREYILFLGKLYWLGQG